MSVGLWVFISEEPFWSKFLNYFSSLHLDSHCSMISGHINWPFFLKKLNWTTRSKSSYNASLLPVSIQSKDRLKLVLNNPFETWLLWALCLLNQCWTFLISSYHIALPKNASPEEKKVKGNMVMSLFSWTRMLEGVFGTSVCLFSLRLLCWVFLFGCLVWFGFWFFLQEVYFSLQKILLSFFLIYIFTASITTAVLRV